MRIPRPLLALTVLPLAFGSVAASSGDCRTADPDGVAGTGDEYELCELQTFFHQAGDSKLGNLGQVNDTVPHGAPFFDENAPTASVDEGAGGGSVSNSAVTQTAGGDQLGAVFEGTFSGYIDAVDVDLHIITPRPNPAAANLWDVELWIDGVAALDLRNVTIVPVPQEGADYEGQQIAYRLDFAVTGIHDALSTLADPGGEHLVRLHVEPTYVGNEIVAAVYDTTEVPGGINFNPVTIPAGTVVLGAS